MCDLFSAAGRSLAWAGLFVDLSKPLGLVTVVVLIVVGLGMWGLQSCKTNAPGGRAGFSVLQVLLVVCAVLFLRWQLHVAITPTNDEIEWKREMKEYGL
ncbi:hypothetical protein KAM385_31450 [Aeromonas hydrophila]|nr:hypothetical protein KAM385_31450 [Aeromonas hydrophila]